MNKKMSFKKRCNTCKGSGFIKTNIELCKKCKRAGDGCYTCRSGIIQLPWSDCNKCCNTGEVFLKI